MVASSTFHQKIIRSVGAFMNTINKYKSGISFLLGVITITSWQLANATSYEKLDASWYVGGGLGMSRLQPDGHSNWDVTDENDTAKKVYGGVNIGRDFGLEAFWNDFGDAKLASTKGGTEAKVDYKGYGANLVYHVPSYIGALHPIAKLGVTKLDTKGDGVTVDQQNKFAITAGIGAEYDLGEGFRLRAEYEYFDKDIDQVSIGLNWRPVTVREAFEPRGVVTQRESMQPIFIVNNPAPVIQHVAAPVPRPVVRRPPPPKPVIRRPPPPKPVVRRPPPRPRPVVKRPPPPKPVVRTVVKHVPVYIERPAPKPIVKTIIKHAPPVVHRIEVARPAPVVRKAPPRTIHKTLAGGSHFATNSASLTNAGRGALDRLASDLLRDQVVIHNIGIIGHTDSIGNPLSNQRLSESRARTVASYLASRGLNRRIMTVLGRGETQPLASNATAAGRAQNRRVNIVVKGSQTIRR